MLSGKKVLVLAALEDQPTGKRNKRFDCVNEKKKLKTSFKADTAIFRD